MTGYAALVRGVMPVGSGKLPSSELKAIGENCGFERVRTYIASGNLLFASDLSAKTIGTRLAAGIGAFFGRHVPVFVRSAREMARVAKENPFADDKPSWVMAIFIDAKPAKAMIDEARDVNGERLALGPGVVYVSYPAGMSQFKLKLPTLKQGTARNMNTVAKLAELAKELE